MNDDDFRDLVHKYRDEDAAALPFQPCIGLFLDDAFCKSIDKIVHSFDGAKWERRVAVSDLGPSLPDQRGLYVFVWKPSFAFRFDTEPFVQQFAWILYIGKAGIEGGEHDTIRRRYLSEYRKYVGGDPSVIWAQEQATKREDRLRTYLTLRPMEYWFLLLDHPPDIRVLERKLIRMFNPPLNQQHGIKMKLGKPEPAFKEPE